MKVVATYGSVSMTWRQVRMSSFRLPHGTHRIVSVHPLWRYEHILVFRHGEGV